MFIRNLTLEISQEFPPLPQVFSLDFRSSSGLATESRVIKRRASRASALCDATMTIVHQEKLLLVTPLLALQLCNLKAELRSIMSL